MIVGDIHIKTYCIPHAKRNLVNIHIMVFFTRAFREECIVFVCMYLACEICAYPLLDLSIRIDFLLSI